MRSLLMDSLSWTLIFPLKESADATLIRQGEDLQQSPMMEPYWIRSFEELFQTTLKLSRTFEAYFNLMQMHVIRDRAHDRRVSEASASRVASFYSQHIALKASIEQQVFEKVSSEMNQHRSCKYWWKSTVIRDILPSTISLRRWTNLKHDFYLFGMVAPISRASLTPTGAVIM